jgi:MFS superfamily sulfate permease-like transporter
VLATQLHTFRPRLPIARGGYNKPRLLSDLGAGFAVGFVALPSALASGMASGPLGIRISNSFGCLGKGRYRLQGGSELQSAEATASGA